MTEKPAPKISARASNQNVIDFPQNRALAPNLSKPLLGAHVNSHELTSIRALTAYVAHNNNVPEDVVRTYLQAEFNIADIIHLRRDDYERAIKFLVDLRCDLLIN